MDPIAKTAYYCCGVRTMDAHSANPVCGDTLAERFMDAEAKAVFKHFEDLGYPNASNAARHRIVDDLLRERLAANPQLRVLLLGAGFDTRAFRLHGGDWLEVDQPSIIAIKNKIMPAAGAPNPLGRMTMDFAKDRLEDKLAEWSDATLPTVVVMEGVTMYLSPEQFADTAQALHRLLPRHTLICDLITRRFARRFSAKLRRRIVALGGEFAELMDDPASLVASQGYRQAASFSIPGRAAEHGSVRLPRWLLNTLLRSLRDGYRIYVFEGTERATEGTSGELRRNFVVGMSDRRG